MPVLEPLVVAHRQRARPDERHLAAQHVDHVRHLVEREPAQEAADAGDARVVANLEERARRLVLRARAPSCCRSASGDHRAELEHPERLLAEPDPRDRRRSIGPRDVSLIASAINSHIGRPTTTISDRRRRGRTTRFVAQSAPAKIGGRSSNSGMPWPGTYSPRSIRSSVVRGATRTLTPRRCACVDDLEQTRLVEPGVGDDQLVERDRVRARPRRRTRARPRRRSRS